MGKKRQRRHALVRARERYNKKFTNKEMYEMGQLIQTFQSKCIRKISNNKTMHIIKYKGVEYKVVYDKKTHRIASFLTMEMK